MAKSKNKETHEIIFTPYKQHGKVVQYRSENENSIVGTSGIYIANELTKHVKSWKVTLTPSN